ncbi:MAG: hypothetical protein SGILL_010045 [Bacillariaceae sp.]
MAREKVGHALRGAISQQKKIPGYDPVSSMMNGAIGAAAATDDDSQTKKSSQDQTSIRSLKRPLPGREAIPSSFCSSSSTTTLKVAATTTQASESLLDERTYKKLKVTPLTAASLTESARNEEALPMTKSAWEDSLKDSSAVFNYDSSFSDDDDDEEESNKKTAGPVPSNPAVAAVAAAPIAAGKPPAWKPPGASGLEASFMQYLSAFQPRPLKEDGCCTEQKVIAGFPPMTAPLPAPSVSTSSTASLASSLGATGLPSSIAEQQALGGLSSASLKANAPFNAVPEDGQRRSSLDGNIISTAGLANLVVDEDIF